MPEEKTGGSSSFVCGGGWVEAPKKSAFRLWTTIFGVLCGAFFLPAPYGVTVFLLNGEPRVPNSLLEWLCVLSPLPPLIFGAAATIAFFIEKPRKLSCLSLEPNPNYDPKNLY